MIKQTKWQVRPAKTQISLGICPVWSESFLSAWRKLGSLATHWVHSEDSDQTGRLPSLIRLDRDFAVFMKKAWVLSYPLSAQQRLSSNWAHAQADLSLHWTHMPFCWFCCEAAHLTRQPDFHIQDLKSNPNNSSYCEGLRRINLQSPHPKLDDNAPRGKLLHVFKQSEHAKDQKHKIKTVFWYSFSQTNTFFFIQNIWYFPSVFQCKLKKFHH